MSFQTPTHLSPDAATGAVVSHELEHVSHEQANARSEGRRVISQNVSIQRAMCPECGRSYVSGGKTVTVTASDSNQQQESTSSDRLLDLFG